MCLCSQLETGVFFEKNEGSVRWMIVYVFNRARACFLSLSCPIPCPSVHQVHGTLVVSLEVILRFCKEPMIQNKIRWGIKFGRSSVLASRALWLWSYCFPCDPYVDWAARYEFCGRVFSSLRRKLGHVSHGGFFWMLVGIMLSIASFTMALQLRNSGNIETIEDCGRVWLLYELWELQVQLYAWRLHDQWRWWRIKLTDRLILLRYTYSRRLVSSK
jgi:hypothetical protein